MKPLDPRLLRLSRTARGFVVAAAGTGAVRTIATIAIAWGIAAAVTQVVDAVRAGVVPATFAGTLALALPAAQPGRRFLTNTDRGHVEAIRPQVERLHPGHRLDVGEPQPTAHVSLAALLLFGTVGIYLVPDPSKEA